MANRITAVAAAAIIAGAGLLSGLVSPQAEQAEGVTNGWQCAQFARLLSGIEIFGDAYTWWRQSMGKYARGSSPDVGAVLVFKPHGARKLGHVAVVSQILTDRVIQVTHANWSRIDGSRGQVEKDVTVQDVSAANDWRCTTTPGITGQVLIRWPYQKMRRSEGAACKRQRHLPVWAFRQ